MKIFDFTDHLILNQIGSLKLTMNQALPKYTELSAKNQLILKTSAKTLK